MKIAALLIALTACKGGRATETPDTVARDMIAKLAAHDSDHARTHFDDKMLSVESAEKLQKFWDGIVAEGGAFDRIETTNTRIANMHQVVDVTMHFAHGSMTLEVAVDAKNHIAGLHTIEGFPAAYDNAASYDEVPVKVGTLPGTLSRPHGAGPFPAVVLVHGSGPGDADETVGALKPFKDLAHGLASRGIAVLRYEKRTHASPLGVVTQHDEFDVAAHEAVALLGATPGIDPKLIVLLGHSQGGFLAPRMAKEDPAIRALVILAGETRTMQDSTLAQFKYFATLDPNDRKTNANVVAAEKFKQQLDDPNLKPDDRVSFPTGGSMTGAYFLDTAGYHPEQVAATLSIPIAVLQGGRDYQVTIKDDFPAWQAALPKATFFTYPADSHPFVSGTGTPSPKDYMVVAHVDPKVIDDLATWILALPK
ncbi:MAG TPA: alpha/beta fold hydrolase [Kofleriaceae bacterium]